MYTQTIPLIAQVYVYETSRKSFISVCEQKTHHNPELWTCEEFLILSVSTTSIGVNISLFIETFVSQRVLVTTPWQRTSRDGLQNAREDVFENHTERSIQIWACHPKNCLNIGLLVLMAIAEQEGDKRVAALFQTAFCGCGFGLSLWW